MRGGATALWVVWLCTLTVSTAVGQSPSPRVRDCDCHRIQLYVQPVCGEDRVWYQNACVAFCAGVEEAASSDDCSGGQLT